MAAVSVSSMLARRETGAAKAAPAHRPFQLPRFRPRLLLHVHERARRAIRFDALPEPLIDAVL